MQPHKLIRFITIPEMHRNNMSTGSGFWHFLYRLVHKFIRLVVISEKRGGNYLAETGTGRHVITMHFGNGDMENKMC